MTPIEIFKSKLIADGYEVTDSTPTTINYSRPSKVGAPPNKATGLKPDIFVEIDVASDKVSFAVDAHNGDGWCTASLNLLDVEYATRHLKTLEKRIVYAWRELTD